VILDHGIFVWTTVFLSGPDSAFYCSPEILAGPKIQFQQFSTIFKPLLDIICIIPFSRWVSSRRKKLII
jgi:hypothetical protein